MVFSLAFSFLQKKLNAQPWYGNIDSLILLPVSPTSNDTLKVVCYSIVPNYPCMMLSSSISINDTIITIDCYHFHGLYTAICTSVDTLTIGHNLMPGYYTILYNLNDSVQGVIDTDTLYFYIPTLTALDHPMFFSDIQIFPNPFSDIISIDLRGNLYNKGSLSIKNIVGQKIPAYAELKLLPNCMNKIDFHSLSTGIYFLEITFDRIQFVRKIVKN